MMICDAQISDDVRTPRYLYPNELHTKKTRSPCVKKINKVD